MISFFPSHSLMSHLVGICANSEATIRLTLQPQYCYTHLGQSIR